MYQTPPFVDGDLALANRVMAAFLNATNQRVYRDSFSVKNDPYSATGNGTTDDYAAVAAANTAAHALSSLLVFPPGTYVLGTSITLYNVCLLPGALLKPSGGVTVTIASVGVALDASQHFTGAGAIAFSAGALPSLMQEWWYDGGGDYTPALTALCNAAPQNQGIAALFWPKIYTYASRFTMPTAGGQNRVQAFIGVPGASADSLPRLSCSTIPGASTPHFDFSAGESKLHLENLRFDHSGGVPASTNRGWAIKLPTGSSPSGTYCLFKNLWISGFDAGIAVTGYTFYSTFDQVRCIGNYSYGIFSNGALWNGSTFRGCQFSQTVNGRGALFAGPGAAMKFDNCFFEGNHVYGIELFGFYQVEFTGCYWEDNDDIDIYMPNNQTDYAAVAKLTDCYLDAAGGGAARIRASKTRLVLEATKFYKTPGLGVNPPVFIETSGGAPTAYPHIAKNCVYPSADISYNDTIWDITDSKHPALRSTTAAPAVVAVQIGDVFFSRDGSMPQILGYRQATRPGWVTAVPTIIATATTVINTNIVTINDISDHLQDGDWIQIAGVTWDGLDRVQIGQVGDQNAANNLIVLSTAGASAGVSGAAITYSAADALQYLWTGLGYIEEYGLAAASGANVALFQFTLVGGQSAAIRVNGIMGSAGATSLGTMRSAVAAVKHDGSGIDLGTVAYYGTADETDGAASWTLVLSEPTAGICRVYVTQATGNALVFGYDAKSVNNTVPLVGFSAA